MNEFDPMIDRDQPDDPSSIPEDTAAADPHASPTDEPAGKQPPHETAQAGGSASDSTYTQDTAAGQSYTNPDGSHGFAYNSDRAAYPNRNKNYRGALIAVSTVLAVVLLACCCLIGAWMAAKSLNIGLPTDDSSDTPGEAGTSGGLHIADDSGDIGKTPGGDPSKNEDGGHISQVGVETAPESATIEKLPAKRVDADGDGRPDVVFGTDGEVLTSADRQVLSAATVVARVADSVVEITTETITQSGLVGQYVTSGAGSGVIIAQEGFIVTNHHVIEGANTITVRLTNGTQFPATLIGSDAETDVAVLWIDAGDTPLTVATLGSSYDLVVGEDVLAIGNPLGSLGGTVTEGMISATARQITVGGSNMTLLQVSAPINPGNSGGGLFNLAGELIGVVNAKVSSEDIEGLGFAIPVDTAYEIIVELIGHGYVRGRPTLGFTIVDVTSDRVAWQYFNSRNVGVYVYDTTHSQVKYGDLIRKVNGKEVTTCSEVIAIIRALEIGDTVELEVYRDRKTETLTVTLVEEIPGGSAA